MGLDVVANAERPLLLLDSAMKIRGDFATMVSLIPLADGYSSQLCTTLSKPRVVRGKTWQVR